VTILGTPQDGQVLVFNGLTSAGGPRWQNDFFARLDFIYLTTNDDVLRIFREARGNASAGISLQNIPTGAAYTFRLPSLPAGVSDVTFAINNLFSLASIVGPLTALPANTPTTATANCTAPAKAVGAGISAGTGVLVNEMTVVSATQVSVKATSSTATSFNAIAYCMSMP
jgi:hypothetical protein